jgi:hypothetical protein
MKRVAHIYASTAKFNSGDFMLGISTKIYFKEKFLNGEECTFYDIDCRNALHFNDDNIEKLNQYDYILVGGGGLILPDTTPNAVSCWQWVIPERNYDKITKPMYVVSIGYNCFYGQDMSMPSRENNNSDAKRIPIFSKNIKHLIEKAKHFSMRHKGDISQLTNIIGNEYRDKIKFELCPSIWHVEKRWKPNLKNDQKIQKCIAIEIKDDREWRRYHKITKTKYYQELEKFVKYCINNKIQVSYMSHDGSKNFYTYLKGKGITIPLLDNSSANEKAILENYSKVKTLFCSAGHSQMIAHGLGIKTISMVSHPKLKYFCEDINDSNYIEINKVENVFEKMKLFL